MASKMFGLFEPVSGIVIVCPGPPLVGVGVSDDLGKQSFDGVWWLPAIIGCSKEFSDTTGCILYGPC